MRRRDLWYKNAIIYNLDVETFMDSNGDGIGDFEGLTNSLDKLAGLGITCIWLLPFYLSPNRDNRYDVMDYYTVDPSLGTLGDFVEFTVQARLHGIRVLVDLVVNHTSIDHPWFQAARQDKNSKYRDYYVWTEEEPEDTSGNVFPGVETGIWSYDEVAGAYYMHRFYHHQPDLNVNNPAVREEIRKIMGFWLQLGVSGFRVDAAPFLIEMKGADVTDEESKYEYLQDFRHFLSWRTGDAILLAEANVAMDEIQHYVGDGDKMHMLFNFYLNKHIFLALARQNAEPIKYALDAAPSLPYIGQWANFLRNHDEIDLGRLSDEERQEVFDAFGPEEDMQIYERGIRRRLAPMLGNDRRHMELAFSLIFTLPGTPVIRYGQEIGMGDDLSLPERNSVRTPMQWANEKNGGFSKASPDKLIRPVISGGEYGYEKVNFADQSRDPDSLLTWMEKVIRVRKECPEFGYGEYHLIETNNPAVLAHRCEWEDGIVIAVHNLSDEKVDFTLELGDFDIDHLIDLLGDHLYEPQNASKEMHLDGFGYRWFRVELKD